MINATKATPKKRRNWRPVFLATFRQTGNVLLSCHAAGIDRSTEPVNPSETPASEDQTCVTSFAGRLIQTSAGTGRGAGWPRTKRSGWTA